MKKSICFLLLIKCIMLFFIAASGHAQVTAYTDESVYLTALNSLGLTAAPIESFENDGIWGPSRYPASANSITSQGIVWSSNFASNNIRTGAGPALTGDWGVFSYPHFNHEQCLQIVRGYIGSDPLT